MNKTIDRMIKAQREYADFDRYQLKKYPGYYMLKTAVLGTTCILAAIGLINLIW